jgi:hypothetical protein
MARIFKTSHYASAAAYKTRSSLGRPRAGVGRGGRPANMVIILGRGRALADGRCEMRQTRLFFLTTPPGECKR